MGFVGRFREKNETQLLKEDKPLKEHKGLFPAKFWLSPFVVAAYQQRKVEEYPKGEAPRHSHPQTTPHAQISDHLLLQYIRSSHHASCARYRHPQAAAHALHKFKLQSIRHRLQRLNSTHEALGRVYELVLQECFVRVFNKRYVVEPNPAGRDTVIITVASQKAKSFGIRRELVKDLRNNTANSSHNGFANVGIIDVEPLEGVAPETSFPLEMLALVALSGTNLRHLLPGN
ncbi:hypothetical protein Salat_1713400 [Sesamum alatum]|uniref:Uncharacterized protein n=1 Tax=Sesamum alatum TaxID=300844 RepID=A0AAE2CK67_9LAMI|nr:hypothetical protein Salat_1713400 [Sesamum alatum]